MAVTINGTTGIVTPDIGVDGTTLVVDAVNNRIGIGQSSPTKTLEVGGGAVSFSPDVAGKHTHEFTTNAANDARYFLRSDTTTKVDIQANGASYFNGGEVLIGTTIDANIKLDVEGSLRAKSAAYVAPTSGVGLELYYATTTLNDTPTAYITSYDRDASAYKKINYDASEHKFRISGTVKLHVTSGGRVGIGESSPTTKLHVAGDVKVVNTGIAYLQPNTVTAFQAYESSGPVKINLNNNGTADFTGRVLCNQWFQSERTTGTDTAFYATVSGTEKLNIRANGSASFAAGAFAIESDGDISTNVRCHGHIELDSTGSFSSPKIKLFSNTGHALVQNLYLGGSLNGGFSYNSTANTLEFLMTNGGTHSELTSNAYVPSATATRHLGYHNKRWDKLFCDGVRFGGNNSDLTTLDDYEEGTYTPTISFQSSGSATLNSSFNTLFYIKIGRLVTISGQLRIASVSSPVGNMAVSLPFTVTSTTTQGRSGGALFWLDIGAGSGNYYKNVPYIVEESSTTLRIENLHHNGGVQFAASDEISFGVTYVSAT